MSTLEVSNLNDGTTTVATTYITNGSAKAWVNFNGTGTVAIRESHNTSSITDDGAGVYSPVFASNLANADYAISGTAMFSTSVNAHFVSHGNNSGAGGTLPTSSGFKIRTLYVTTSANAQDCTIVGLSINGDLA